MGLKKGDSGVYEGIRYEVDAYTRVVYNVNDLAKFFGINKTFHVDLDEIDDAVVLIIK